MIRTFLESPSVYSDKPLRNGCRYSSALLFVLLLFSAASAEGLSTKTYTTAQGLAHDYIARIFRDPQGFLWFCTSDGLSRFDGEHFTTYGLDQGLRVPAFNYFLATRDGAYWVATNGSGVCRFNHSPSNQNHAPVGPIRSSSETAEDLFTVYPVGDSGGTNRVNVLLEDRSGRIWAGSDAGLFVLDAQAGDTVFAPADLGIPGHPDATVQVLTMVEDREGNLWVGTKYGLVGRQPNGRTFYELIHPLSKGTDIVLSLWIDSENRLWLGHEAGLAVFNPIVASQSDGRGMFSFRALRSGSAARSRVASGILPSSPGEARWFTSADGLGSDEVYHVTGLSNGRIYLVTTGGGLTEFDGTRFRVFSKGLGISDRLSPTVAEDLAGNIWLATPGEGAIRIARSGFETYTKVDGRSLNMISQIFNGSGGDTYLFGSGWRLLHLEQDQLKSVRLNLPAGITDLNWRTYHRMIQDHLGEWWVTTTEGLFRFPRVGRFEQLGDVRPKAVYTIAQGLAGNDVASLFEDSRGDLWIGTFAPDREVVVRWERSTEKVYRYSDDDGLRPLNSATAFCEDRAGDVWIGFRDGGLARYRLGRFTLFTSSADISGEGVYDLRLDRTGRIWSASRGRPGGLLRVDNPDSDRPGFRKYSIADGLASERVVCITEDDRGRIYAGTLRGIDRIDPETDEIRNFTIADSLTEGGILAAETDLSGHVWFGTRHGALRLSPEPDQSPPPPPVYIGGLRVSGRAYRISAFGEIDLGGLELEPDQNQIEISFFGLSFASDGSLRYQYKIDGANQDWSLPTDQRSVNASLQPGEYRFLVRAVGVDGRISTTPASVSFTILPLVWQRWWFITLAGLFAAFAVYAFYRYRVRRVIELERVRTRIATDLHDDIGSSLSQVSVLSEVIRRRVGSEPSVSEPLSMISRLSSDVVDSMSDIVWAVNPQRDHLADLTHRMRRLASDVLTAKEIDFSFRAPEDHLDIKMGADVRREVFLIFKESLNNIVRHSGCARAEIELRVAGRRALELEITDDGKGFDVDKVFDGNGLSSMNQRADRLAGNLEIRSAEGRGTTVWLRAPIGGRAGRKTGKR
jgi:ligand-binding sensor domain-containing protein/two-component sensor histidine kinase